MSDAMTFSNGLTTEHDDAIDDIMIDISRLALLVEELGRHRSYSLAVTKLKFDRESIAKCLFHTAMAGHAQWDDMSKPNKDDWRAKADIWILDVTNLKAQRAALSVPVSSPSGSGK